MYPTIKRWDCYCITSIIFEDVSSCSVIRKTNDDKSNDNESLGIIQQVEEENYIPKKDEKDYNELES